MCPINVPSAVHNIIYIYTGTSTPYKLSIANDESITHVSCGQNHNFLITKKNNIIIFGDNSYHQCSSTMYKDKNKIISPLKLCKQSEFHLNQHCWISKVECYKNQTKCYFDIHKRYKC